MLPHTLTAMAQLAPNVEDAIVRELDSAGLNKTGKLAASVQAVMVHANDGYELQAYMYDYGLYQDAKHGFMDKAFSSIKSDIENSIQQGAEADIVDSLNQIFQS